MQLTERNCIRQSNYLHPSLLKCSQYCNVSNFKGEPRCCMVFDDPCFDLGGFVLGKCNYISDMDLFKQDNSWST